MKIKEEMVIAGFIHVMYLITICVLIMFVIWRQNVARKWEERAFITLELYHDICKKHNENIKYIP